MTCTRRQVILWLWGGNSTAGERQVQISVKLSHRFEVVAAGSPALTLCSCPGSVLTVPTGVGCVLRRSIGTDEVSLEPKDVAHLANAVPTTPPDP